MNIQDKLVEAVVNGWVNVARHNGNAGKVNSGKLATEGPKVLAANPERYRHGKTMLGGIRDEYRTQKGQSLKGSTKHELLSVPSLQAIAKKVFGGGR